MSRFLSSCVLIVFALFHIPDADAAWGAVPPSNSLRPSQAFISSFPSVNTVTVNNGDSVETRIAECNQNVGPSGYCRVFLQGTPSETTGFSITRSRTMIVGATGNVLTGSGDMAFVSIGSGISEIVVQGLEIQGHSANYHAGIEIEGANIAFIAIKNCRIRDFNAGNGDAHAIIVRGTSSSDNAAVQHIIIDGNDVFDMKLGSSEAIAINGNVKRWVISNNDVYDINNIAIDAIGLLHPLVRSSIRYLIFFSLTLYLNNAQLGGEGTSPATTVNGRIVPGTYDAARLGWIEDNFVENLSTLTNPAYGSKHTWAAAVYVDGARQITIQNNVVVNAAWGYEVGGENCVTTSDIFLTGNSATGSYFGDFVAGGYASVGFLVDTNIDCNPATSSDSGEGHGYVKRVTATSNQFSSTAVQVSVIEPQNRLTETIIVDPNAVTENTNNNGFATGDANAIRTTL